MKSFCAIAIAVAVPGPRSRGATSGRWPIGASCRFGISIVVFLCRNDLCAAAAATISGDCCFDRRPAPSAIVFANLSNGISAPTGRQAGKSDGGGA